MEHSRYERADLAACRVGRRPGPSLVGATLLLLLAVSSPAFGEPGLADASTFERIDDHLVGRMAKFGIPGMAVGFVGIDGVLHWKGYGAADPSGREVTPQTPFVIGSVSKPFTALAIMQLSESGRLEIDDRVVTHLPWFRLAGGEGDAITVRQLLLQTSGIGAEAEWQVAATGGGDSLDDLVRKMAAMKPAGAAGSGYRYSNANYIILGRVVEAVSGMPHGEYVGRFIFEPLGMRHSHGSRPKAELDGLARGHVSWFGLSRPSSLPYRNDFAPAYYIISCAEDMTRFLAMFMNGGTLGSISLLSADGIAEMLTAGDGSRYGMG